VIVFSISLITSKEFKHNDAFSKKKKFLLKFRLILVKNKISKI